MRLIPALLVSVALTAFAACSDGEGNSFVKTDGGTEDGGPVVNPDLPDSSSTKTDGSLPAGPPQVFGHSADTLYKVDPDTKAVTTVGKFTGCDGKIVDIAIDKDSNAVGVSDTTMYKINLSTGACTVIGSNGAPYPNSLSFVPAGTRNATREALVGYGGSSPGSSAGDGTYYIEYDPATGNEVWRSPNAVLPSGLVSSGDIVSAISATSANPTYLTVKGSYKNGSKTVTCKDCIVQINPATGVVLKNFGPFQYANVFGIAFWGGVVYGFDSAGDLFSIKFPTSGSTLTVTDIAIPNAPAGLSFFGAGSTTSAPTEGGR